MTKQEFIEKYTDYEFISAWEVDPVKEMKKDLDALIQTAINEHEAAILDDIEFGYDLEMIKGKLINKSYQP